MMLLYGLIFIFLVVVGWVIYSTIKQQPPSGSGRNCPEDDPCNGAKPQAKPRRCHRCYELMPQCRCYEPCKSC